MTSLDIDTRSDLSSLGVPLYELLTGRTPFDGKELLKAGLDEMRRVIREGEPVKPGTRLVHELTTANARRSLKGGMEKGRKGGTERAPRGESPFPHFSFSAAPNRRPAAGRRDSLSRALTNGGNSSPPTVATSIGSG